MKNDEQIYAKIALSQIPRLLSMMDRKKGSRTFGCADRVYWRYKMIDFPTAGFQIVAYPLALIYKNRYPENLYYNNAKIKDWSIAAMEFLPNAQNFDGSLKDTYPYIWSVAAVAFPTIAISEAYLLLENELSEYSKEVVIDVIRKTGNWLLKSHDKNVINQESAALIALFNVSQITGDKKYEKGAEDKLKFLLSNRSPEGWFNEYGGADIAYSTIVIDSLAKYYQKTRNKDLLKIINDLIEFVSYFVHPNGTMGGEYASRNPEWIIPSGFEILSKDIPLASAIAESNINALNQGELINPATIDDFYSRWMLHTYLQAYDNYSPRIYKDIKLPHEREQFTRYFSLAKFLVIKKDLYYMIIGASKGGVIRIYRYNKDKPDLFFSDCGYLGISSNGEKLASQWLDYSDDISVNEDKCTISISGKFHKINETLLTPTKMILSRIGLKVISRMYFARDILYQRLRKVMITGDFVVPIEFVRNVNYDNDSVLISDCLKFRNKFDFKQFGIVDKFSPIYAQSTEFFQKQELSNISPIPEKNLSRFIKGVCELKINRKIHLDGRDFEYDINCKPL